MSASHIIQGEWSLSRAVAAAGSNLRLPELLVRVVESLADAPECASIAFYIWDSGRNRLELSASGPPGRPWPRGYRLGEDIVGRTGLRRHAVSEISQPQHLAVPSSAPAGRGQRRVTSAAPVLSGENELLGVLCVVGEPAFMDRIAQLATDGAQLIALAIQCNAARERSRQLEELLSAVELVAGAAAGKSAVAEVLATVASLGVHATSATTCAVYVGDPTRGNLQLNAVSPDDAPVPARWLDATAGEPFSRAPGTYEFVVDAGAGRAPALLGLDGWHVVVASAACGPEQLGLVMLATPPENRLTQDEAAMAGRLANIVSIALWTRRLAERSVDHPRSGALMWELLGANGPLSATLVAQALRFGFDFRQGHCVLVADAVSVASAGKFRSALMEADGRALVDLSGTRVTGVASADILAILPGGHSRLCQILSAEGGISIGASRPCTDVARYGEAYRQAEEALALGRRLFGVNHLTRFDDLGAYRFVSALLEHGLTPDLDHERVFELPDELLTTLDVYLDSGGNTAATAKALYLHRNTVRQRLERISRVLETDLAAPNLWMALQLSVKTARLLQLRPSSDSFAVAEPVRLKLAEGRRPSHVAPAPAEVTDGIRSLRHDAGRASHRNGAPDRGKEEESAS